jgi:hypothetical protein
MGADCILKLHEFITQRQIGNRLVTHVQKVKRVFFRLKGGVFTLKWLEEYASSKFCLAWTGVLGLF